MQYPLSTLLKKLRSDEPLRDAAARIGISHTYLNILEKGVDPRSGSAVKPSAETLQKLARAYGYPYEKLLETAGYLDRGRSDIETNGEPAPAEFEKVLREANVMFDGAVLDDEDKEDIIQFVKVAMRAIKKRKE